MSKIDSFIADLSGSQQEIVTHLRHIIKETSLGIVETYKFNCPYYEYKKHLCYIYTRKDEVILGFVHGKLLAEKNPILVGEQKQVRHIIIKEITEQLDDQIRFILQEAVLLNDKLYKTDKRKWYSQPK